MRINHNLSAINTHRQLADNTFGMNRAVERLSSGLRINRAGDDAAGLAISEKMRGQVRGLQQASRNAQDGISLIQTAEAAMSTTHNILQRMRELAVQSANDTSTDADRAQLQKELEQLKAEIDRVAYTTEFNTKKLLNGNLTAAKQQQGSRVQSSALRVEDFVSTPGSATGGQSITERGSVQTVIGQGFSETGFNELQEYTRIAANANDKFFFRVNGGTVHSGTIAASTGAGYTRAQFASAIQDAITAELTAHDENFEKNQLVVSVTADHKLRLQTKEAGVETVLSISDPTGSESRSALASMGFGGYQNRYEGTADLNAGYTVVAGATNGSISLTVGNVSSEIKLDSGTYSKAQLLTGLQNKLDTAFGTGIVTVSDSDSDGRLEFSSSLRVNAFTINSGAAASASGLTGLIGLAAAASGSGGLIATGTTVTASGSNSVLGYSNGIRIVQGVNDQLRLAVDNETGVTITLSDRLYETKQDLVNELNSQISANAALLGKVSARLTADNKIEFSSVKTGSLSTVEVYDPDAASQSALGALGFGPTVGKIDGNVDISNGIQLSGSLSNFKLDITLGNKTASLNLLNQANIIQSGGSNAAGGATTRDAIVRALQAELDNAFGAGAVNVSTVTSGSEETLRFNTAASASKFVISSAAGASGVNFLIQSGAAAGQGVSGTVGATPGNVRTTGLDGVHHLLATNTVLTRLADGDGNNLGLTEGNVITFQGTQNGKAFAASMTVQSGSTIGDLMGLMRSVDAFQGASVSLDLVRGLIDIDGKAGAEYDLSNLKLTAKRSAVDDTPVGGFNRPLGDFSILRHAQDASSDRSLRIQVGANQGTVDSIDIGDVSVGALKLSFIGIGTKEDAAASISVIENAMERISDERAKLGAIQNRLENTVYDLGIFAENLTASDSRIRDVDMARETLAYTRQSILSQASTAMLAQANQQSATVLYLMR